MLLRKSLLALGLLVLSVTALADWNNGRHDRDHRGDWDHGRDERVTCVAKNLRGADYFGFGFGRDAYGRASEDAMMKCRRDSILPGSCHIINCRS